MPILALLIGRVYAISGGNLVLSAGLGLLLIVSAVISIPIAMSRIHLQDIYISL
ncbi:hypothetical protein M422DRAFT_244303 [Sphaerobolus stellatus SS14]|nr:hypothetical protein M422DRAFT_244303 [Sphaerobolus stellatus SS14]